LGSGGLLGKADPRLSSLRRFARALDIPLAELVEEKKKGR